MNQRLGVHTSISGGIYRAVERALDLGCTTMQIFSHNPRQWKMQMIKEGDILRFRSLLRTHDVCPVFIHASYLINLASISSLTVQRSIEMLSYELYMADLLGVDGVVVHTACLSGDVGGGAVKRALRSIKGAMGQGRFRSRIILENTADRGDGIESLARIIDGCHGEGIRGVCIDTCHAFASGYDISTPSGSECLIKKIDEYIGIERLILIHVNDSRGACGSGIDRHEHIGRGRIGIKGFRNFLLHDALSGIPLILETPKTSDEDDRRNLSVIKKILTSEV